MKADAVIEDFCLNLTRQWTRPDDLKTEEEYQKTDWTRPDDLKTQEKYQKIGPDKMIRRPQVTISSEDFCLNLTREDWSRPDDLKTPDHYQRRLDQDDPRGISDADPETGLQKEEEPDFCRKGCVEKDGEE
ncbi:hypothetical protein Bbelb_216250 [Branchiostoma belcheri]|nr:hypothetical protein Bbelb_216250 [Branchiostoma belcheri]